MLYRQRHKIEKCSAGSRTGGHRTRYDRCAHAFFSAICIAATVGVLVVINES